MLIEVTPIGDGKWLCLVFYAGTVIAEGVGDSDIAALSAAMDGYYTSDMSYVYL